MSRAIAWFVENPVAANLLMGLILLGGVVALPAIQQKTMPDLEVDIVEVSVEYLGAAPWYRPAVGQRGVSFSETSAARPGTWTLIF